MAARTAGRKGRPWRRFRKQVLLKYGRVCHLCDEPIDTSLHPRSPWAFVVDHDPPLALGGAPMNLATARPAHRYCNGVRGTKPVHVARAILAKRKAAGTINGRAGTRRSARTTRGRAGTRRPARTSCAW